MEKVEKPLIKKYPILRLYKSDLEEIFNLLKGNYPEIEIVADGFKLDDFSELSKIDKKEIVDFKITADDPEEFLKTLALISVDFSRDSAVISLSDEDDIKQRGLAAQIGDILSHRKSCLRFFANPWTLSLLALIPIILILSLIKEVKTQLYSFPFLVLFIVLLDFWAFKIDSRKHCLIYLYDRSSAPGFFKKNKDSILISVISALMGGIITLGIALLLKKI